MVRRLQLPIIFKGPAERVKSDIWRMLAEGGDVANAVAAVESLRTAEAELVAATRNGDLHGLFGGVEVVGRVNIRAEWRVWPFVAVENMEPPSSIGIRRWSETTDEFFRRSTAYPWGVAATLGHTRHSQPDWFLDMLTGLAAHYHQLETARWAVDGEVLTLSGFVGCRIGDVLDGWGEGCVLQRRAIRLAHERLANRTRADILEVGARRCADTAHLFLKDGAPPRYSAVEFHRELLENASDELLGEHYLWRRSDAEMFAEVFVRSKAGDWYEPDSPY